MKPSADILFLRFDELTTPLLYAILRLRQEVFLVEQQRFYLDCDGRDQVALHALARDDDALVGYLRILPPGIAYDTAAIGRVAIAAAHRNRGIGFRLVQESMQKIQALWGGGVTLSAQLPTVSFYERLGFRTVGEPYEEAGIDHIKMARAA